MKLKSKKIVLEWFERARSDYQYAKAGQRETAQHHITCYLCHQAVEKILKALLIGAGETPPKVHNLRQLFALVAPFYAPLTPLKTEMNRLDSYYISSRYPGPVQFEFNADDARFALKIAGELIRSIDALLKG